MKRVFLFFLLFTIYTVSAQTDTCKYRISLLTCTPGQELYSTFGHSALRVMDNSGSLDVVFNYGTFDFEDPDFYNKFIKGKLLYFVSTDKIDDFLYEYQYFKRGVFEQVINMSCEKKQKLVDALFENAKEENKYYRYDFTDDNCTTRLRDMVEKAAGEELITKNLLPNDHTSFRDLIHLYLEKGGQRWSEFGIDILLGSPLDKIVTNRESMFLPDYMLMAFDSSTLHGRPLVLEKNVLLEQENKPGKKQLFTPLIVFGLLFLIIFVNGIFSKKYFQLLKIFDAILFFSLGLIGILLIFMWFGTDHVMTKNNYNLLWALPIHILSGIFLFMNNPWIRIYFRYLFFYTIALLLAWFFLPQQFNIAFLPIAAIVLIRSYFIYKGK